MAEIGLAASLLGIASFGVKLTTTLYKFGSTASAAREQTDYVARHVTLYSDVLELLAQRIDDDEPVHSNKALDLVDEICDQSYDLFDKIRDRLPERSDKLSFLQKLKWNFRKQKVDLLVAEIEYLKSTVNLLVTILYAGKKLRASKRRRQSKKAQEEAHIQYAKAQNAIIEQLNATATKDSMQARANEDESEDKEVTLNQQAPAEHTIRKSSALIKHTPPISLLQSSTAMFRFNQSLTPAKKDTPHERSLVVQNSDSLVKGLLDEWTSLGADKVGDGSGESTQDRSKLATTPEDEREVPRTTTHTAASQGQAIDEAAAKMLRLEQENLRSQNTVRDLEAELERLKRRLEKETADAVNTGMERQPPRRRKSQRASWESPEREPQPEEIRIIRPKDGDRERRQDPPTDTAAKLNRSSIAPDPKESSEKSTRAKADSNERHDKYSASLSEHDFISEGDDFCVVNARDLANERPLYWVREDDTEALLPGGDNRDFEVAWSERGGGREETIISVRLVSPVVVVDEGYLVREKGGKVIIEGALTQEEVNRLIWKTIYFDGNLGEVFG